MKAKSKKEKILAMDRKWRERQSIERTTVRKLTCKRKTDKRMI